MGNCVAPCNPSIGSCITDVAVEKGKVLRVVKTDGKVLTFGAPVLVKDVLANFADSGIGVSMEGSEHLPPNYELAIGKVYYLLPSLSCSKSRVTPSPSGISSRSVARGKEKEQGTGIRRIKIIISKQQLQELLEKQISMEEILKGLNKKAYTSPVVTSPHWKPKLESIPEGSEFINFNVVHS